MTAFTEANLLEKTQHGASLNEDFAPTDTTDVEPLLDEEYIQKTMSFFKEALQNGKDVAQLADGDLLVTERKIVTYRYQWNEARKRFERTSNNVRKSRKSKKS